MQKVNIIQLFERMGLENPSTDTRVRFYTVKYLARLDETKQDDLQILEYVGLPASILKELIKENKKFHNDKKYN